MSIAIEDNVPAPVKNNWKGKLNELEIGQSFEFPIANRSSIANRISVDFHALTLKRFTISGNRVWRIDDAEEKKA